MPSFEKIFEFAFGPLVVGLVVGLVIRWLGNNDIDRRSKMEAIKDLMTFRGDLSSQDFRRSLNKVSITFHNDSEVRAEVRHLYEVINDPSTQPKITERTIVGLIYKLCKKNGFEGLTEYDIDQAFPESRQEPDSVVVGKNKTPN
jgi:hypothetical protein